MVETLLLWEKNRIATPPFGQRRLAAPHRLRHQRPRQRQKTARRRRGKPSIATASAGDTSRWGNWVAAHSARSQASGGYKQKPILNAKLNDRAIAYARPAPNARANQRLKRLEQISYEEGMAFRTRKPSNTSLQLVFSAAALRPILAGPVSQACSQRANRR